MTAVIQKTLTDLLHTRRIPGLAVRIAHAQQTVYSGDFGLADLENQHPIHPGSVFEIASVTKLFTAQLVMALAQSRRLSLDDRLIDHLPDHVPTAWAAVTIRHVLAHQSGLPSYTAPDAYWAQTVRDKTHDEVLALVNSQPLMFDPGARYHYDNTGFYLLGLLIEALYAQPYADVLARVIFQPLGMSSTRANDYDTIIPGRVKGYRHQDGVLCNKPYYSPSNTFSAGCVLSTADDLLRWRASLSSDVILDAAHRALWQTPHPPTAYAQSDPFVVALGWFHVQTALGTLIGHNGGIVGFASAWLYLPAHDITAVVLCNTSDVEDPHTIALAAITHLL
jgi:CubicO group peptidase (beta-lactamase class C family)